MFFLQRIHLNRKSDLLNASANQQVAIGGNTNLDLPK